MLLLFLFLATAYSKDYQFPVEAECGTTTSLGEFTFAFKLGPGGGDACNLTITKNSSTICGLAARVEGDSCNEGRIALNSEEWLCGGDGWKRFRFEEGVLELGVSGEKGSEVVVHGKQVLCGEGLSALVAPNASGDGCVHRIRDSEFTVLHSSEEDRGCVYSIGKNNPRVCDLALRVEGVDCRGGHVLLGKEKVCGDVNWRMFKFEGDVLTFHILGGSASRSVVYGRQVECGAEFSALDVPNNTTDCVRNVGDREFTIRNIPEHGCTYAVEKNNSGICDFGISIDPADCHIVYVILKGQIICGSDSWNSVEFSGNSLEFKVVVETVSNVVVRGRQTSCKAKPVPLLASYTNRKKCIRKLSDTEFNIRYRAGHEENCVYELTKNNSGICRLGLRVNEDDCKEGQLLLGEDNVCGGGGDWMMYHFNRESLDLFISGIKAVDIEGLQIDCPVQLDSQTVQVMDGKWKMCRKIIPDLEFNIQLTPGSGNNCTYAIEKNNIHICSVNLRVRGGNCREEYLEVEDIKLCERRDWEQFEFGENIVEFRAKGINELLVEGKQISCVSTCHRNISSTYFRTQEDDGMCLYTVKKNNSRVCGLRVKVIEGNCVYFDKIRVCKNDGPKRIEFKNGTTLGRTNGGVVLEGWQVDCHEPESYKKEKCHKRILGLNFHVRDPEGGCNYTVVKNNSRVCGLRVKVRGVGCVLVGGVRICDDDGHKSVDFNGGVSEVQTEGGVILEGTQVECLVELHRRCRTKISDRNFHIVGTDERCSYVLAKNNSDVCGLVVEAKGRGCVKVGRERVCGGRGPKRIEFASEEIAVLGGSGFDLMGRQVSCTGAAAYRRRSCCGRGAVFRGRRVRLVSPEGGWDCEMRVIRHNPRTCRIRITFEYFWVGRGRQGYGCEGGLEVDGYIWCGCQTGLVWTTSEYVFDEASNEAVFRLREDGLGWQRGRRRGFIIIIEQIDCFGSRYPPGHSYIPSHMGVRSKRSQWTRWDSRCLEGPPPDMGCDGRAPGSDFPDDYPCQLLEGTSGIIASPGYPQYYPPQSAPCYRSGEDDCGWDLYFHDFDFPEASVGGECRGGYTDIAGNRYCARSLASTSMRLERGGKIRVSGTTKGHRGFLAKYSRLKCPQDGDYDGGNNGDYDGGNNDDYDGGNNCDYGGGNNGDCDGGNNGDYDGGNNCDYGGGNNGDCDGGNNGDYDGGNNCDNGGGNNGDCDGGNNGDYDGGNNGDYDGGNNGDYDGGNNGDYDGGDDNNRPGRRRCSFVYRGERFSIQGRSRHKNCLYTIKKSSQDVCGLELEVKDLDLECGKETLFVSGRYYCGRLNRETVRIPFPDEGRFTIEYRTSSPRRTSGRFTIVGRQLYQCTGSWETMLKEVSVEECLLPVQPISGTITQPSLQIDQVHTHSGCTYQFIQQKGMCYLKLDFKQVLLPTSGECRSDYIQLEGKRTCGQTLYNTSRVLAFPDNGTVEVPYRLANRQGEDATWTFSYSQLPCVTATQ